MIIDNFKNICVICNNIIIINIHKVKKIKKITIVFNSS